MYAESQHQDLDRLLNIKEVVQLTTLSRPTIYRMISRGDFPRPIKIGAMRVGFRLSLIKKFMLGGVQAA